MDFSLELTATTWAGLIVVYGLLVAIAGIVGYLKARSKISLMSGLGSGVGLAIAAYTTTQNAFFGLLIAIFIALCLLSVFTIRWLKTKAMMPAGGMAILSLVAVVVFAIAFIHETAALS